MTLAYNMPYETRALSYSDMSERVINGAIEII